MNRIIVAIVSLGLAIAVPTGWWLYQQGKYDRVKVNKGDIQVVVTAPGEIEAEEKANLAFKATGRISYLPAKENDEVKKWQTLASLDRTDLQAVKEKELEDYMIARWDFETTQRDTYKDQVLTDVIQRTKDKFQFELNQSVLDVEIADRAVDNASLYAPFDGIVTQVNGEVNEWVSAFSSTPLVQLVNFSTLYFEAEVDQKESDRIRVGQKVTVKLDAKEGQSFAGIISKIDKVARDTTDGDRVVMVKIRLEGNRENLKLGWEGDAQIVLEEKSAVVLVPKGAVEKVDGKMFVSVWESWRIVKRPVEVGVFDGANWEIREGITDSEELAVTK